MSSAESRGTSRSGFLKQAAGATVVAASAGAGAGVFAQAAAASGSLHRPPMVMFVDGENCGKIGGVDGGDLDYDVVYDVVTTEHVQHKHLGQPKYEDITVQVGSNMSKSMYDWIQASLDSGFDPSLTKSISITRFDRVTKADTGSRQASRASISSVTIPALDGASKEAASLTVTISAPSTVDNPPSGVPVQGAKHKAWLPSNFVFEVDGLDTSRVNKIEALVVKQKVVEDAQGTLRSVLDAGNLVVTFDPSSLASWQSWYDNFDVGGDTTDERSGKLTLVGAQGGAVVTFSLSNLGLYRLRTPGDFILSTTSGRVCVGEMYSEAVAFTAGAGF